MKNNSKFITYGGVFTALGMILIYVSAYLPTSKLSLLCVTSLIIIFSILTIGSKYSLIVYFATSSLSLIIIGFKAAPITYIIFFGIYGFVKLYTEKLKNRVIEYIIKYLYFNLAITIFYLLYKSIFGFAVNLKYPIIILIVIFEIVFIVFDYILTLFISYASKKFINKHF